jgi:hypothetical protein
MTAGDDLRSRDLKGRRADEVATELERLGVSVEVRAVEVPTPIALLFELTPSVSILEGDFVELIETGNRVLAVRRHRGGLPTKEPEDETPRAARRTTKAAKATRATKRKDGPS